jgi:hypothetical protein
VAGKVYFLPVAARLAKTQKGSESLNMLGLAFFSHLVSEQNPRFHGTLLPTLAGAAGIV